MKPGRRSAARDAHHSPTGYHDGEVGTVIATLATAMVDALADAIAARCHQAHQVEDAKPSDWKLRSVPEAAAALSRSPRWVRQRVKDRELAVVKLDGGALAFREADLQAFVDARVVPARDR